MEELQDYQVLPVEQQGVEIISVDALERANVDSQVTTAKHYPRDLRRSIENSIVMATMDDETARSCGYALPRGGKTITGPSVHLARIIASNWGNLRTDTKVVRITDEHVVSRGMCWDLETNVASAFEVRRSIIGKEGKRYTDDMITVTGNAASAIAYRNAVFSVIPKAIVDKIYNAAQRKITGDLSNEEILVKRRSDAINYFKDEYGITEQEVVRLCGKNTVNQIREKEMAILVGITQAIKDGDTTVDELMKPYRTNTQSVEFKKKQMKDQKSKSLEMP